MQSAEGCCTAGAGARFFAQCSGSLTLLLNPRPGLTCDFSCKDSEDQDLPTGIDRTDPAACVLACSDLQRTRSSTRHARGRSIPDLVHSSEPQIEIRAKSAAESRKEIHTEIASGCLMPRSTDAQTLHIQTFAAVKVRNLTCRLLSRNVLRWSWRRSAARPRH